ncbi:hypothetical protein FRC12_009514 [Ceratobasidium sp. 428]|nr:hypothetical protein FRC12_009514 [Ceratobasidium sp. 428]
MPPARVYLRCRRCHCTYGSDSRLRQHIANTEKCRGREERYLATLQAREETTPDSPAPNPVGGPPLDAAAADNGPLDAQLVDLEEQSADERAPQNEDDLPSEDGSREPDPPKPPPRKTHGYAKIETHPRAAKVFEWVEPRRTFPLDNPLNKAELFKTGKWLCQLPISNEDRMLYFDIERHKRDIPWENATQLYQSLDALPHGPDWSHKYMSISTPQGVEVLDLWRRNSLEVVQELIGDPRFADRIRYAPEAHYRIKPDGQRVRVQSKACTGDWWWRTQDMLGPNATIASVILATDATQLSLISGGNKVWPVYMGIANIDKAVRRHPSERAMILVGYIPIPDLSFITNAEERGRKKWEIYHAAMKEILAPLQKAASQGVKMVCADGGVRLVHPIVAAHLADFEEQCLASCTQKTRCPVCDVQMHDRGDGQGGGKIRTRIQILQALGHERRGYTLT